MRKITPGQSASKTELALMTTFLEAHAATWTRSGDEFNLFGKCSDEAEEMLSFMVGTVLHGTVEEVAVAPSSSVTAPHARVRTNGRVPWSDVTWYQFRTYVQADTGILPRIADVLDKVLGFTVVGEGKQAVYTWSYYRVDYTESKARYRGTRSYFQMVQVRYNTESHKWESETLEINDTESAPDLVKYNEASVSAHEAWLRRKAEAQPDWSSRAGELILRRAKKAFRSGM